jgi:hypothetical protein
VGKLDFGRRKNRGGGERSGLEFSLIKEGTLHEHEYLKVKLQCNGRIITGDRWEIRAWDIAGLMDWGEADF